MSVVIVDRTFSTGINTTVDDKGWITATASIQYNVFVDNPLDNDATVKSSYAIPKEKMRHPYFLNLFCSGVNVARKTGLHFEVTANYESAPYKDADNPQSPLNEPTEVSFFSISTEGEVKNDINGDPIRNTAKTPMSGITRTFSDLGIRLTKNFATFDPASFYLYIDTVNSDTFLGFPPGTLKLMSITADEQYYEENPYYKVSVEIHARKPYGDTPNDKAWYARWLNEGLQELDDNGEQRDIAPNGFKVTEPKSLDEDGHVFQDQEEGIYKYTELYEKQSFSSLGF